MKYFILVLVLILSPFSYSHAQVDLTVGDEGLSLDINPIFPEPYSEFTVSLNDYSFDSNVIGIKWKVDNKIISEATNQRKITLRTKNANEKITIDTTVELIGGGTQTVRKIINPIYLDIVIEPQTRTPAFYLGRSLPSIGSKVNLTAIVNSDAISRNDLVYTWQINNTVIEGGSLRARNKISTTVPLDQYSIVTVSVSKSTGETLATHSTQITAVEPSIYFYEMNPLYGQSIKPITILNLIGESSTIKAEPYNLDLATYNSPDLIEWKLGNRANPASSGNPYEITLAREVQLSSGESEVNFHVRNLTNLLQGGKGGFRLNF